MKLLLEFKADSAAEAEELQKLLNSKYYMDRLGTMLTARAGDFFDKYTKITKIDVGIKNAVDFETKDATKNT